MVQLAILAEKCVILKAFLVQMVWSPASLFEPAFMRFQWKSSCWQVFLSCALLFERCFKGCICCLWFSEFTTSTTNIWLHKSRLSALFADLCLDLLFTSGSAGEQKDLSPLFFLHRTGRLQMLAAKRTWSSNYLSFWAFVREKIFLSHTNELNSQQQLPSTAQRNTGASILRGQACPSLKQHSTICLATNPVNLQ